MMNLKNRFKVKKNEKKKERKVVVLRMGSSNGGC
jgi:hypothetical protein